MKFEFSFEKLLDHKRSMENVARREFNEAQAAVDKATLEMKAMYQAIDDARLRVAELSVQGGPHAAQMGSIDAFIGGQKLRIEMFRTKVRELMMVAEEKQELLMKAAMERKTLEKLKERKFEDFKLRRKKRELKDVDELVTTRFKRPEGN